MAEEYIDISSLNEVSVKRDILRDDQDGMGYAMYFPTAFPSPLGIGDWWSTNRDLSLDIFTRKNDHLKIAVNTFISKASAVPLRFIPEESSSQALVNIATELAIRLQNNSELFKGFSTAFKKFQYDFCTQDNGAFMYVYGDGNKLEPIIGMPYGVEHLPAKRCTRTSNPEFPVRYMHQDGKKYALHFTRVIEMANLPSPDPAMNGVGMCPISLCLDAAQELFDIAVYSHEKLGSRPQRQILYARTGATINQLMEGVSAADIKLDGQGNTRFAKTMLLAPKLPGGKLELELIDLVNAPDGFDRQTITMLDLAVIVASFGLDLTDVAYSFGIQGQTKSTAEVQHEKGFGKGVAEFLNNFAIELSKKYCPEKIDARFDYVDDAQDLTQAEIRGKRTQSRVRDIMAGVATVRSTRLQMVQDHEISDSQFEAMELEDSRLVDGTEIFRLLHTSDTYIKAFLVFSEDYPEDSESEDNDPLELIAEINENLVRAYEELEKVGRADNKQRKVKQVIALLVKLKKSYTDKQTQLTQQQQMIDNQMLTENVSTDKPNNALSPQERMNKVAGKGTQVGMKSNVKSGGQNGTNTPL